MRNVFLILTLNIAFAASAQTPWRNIPTTVTLFPVASTEMSERDMAISPDGKEMYYTLQGNQHSYSVILHRSLKPDNTWSAPEVAPFSGVYSDLEPAFSTDGKKIFFSSDRPKEGKDSKDYDIWYVEKKGNAWSAPINAGREVNTDENEFYPSLSASGNLYFTAEYEKGIGKEDIYVSRWTNNAFGPSTPLDTAVNKKTWEFNAYVSPDEKFIIFTAYGRKNEGDQGGGDLYISMKDDDGNWKPSRPLVQLNSPRLDYCPFVTFDGRVLFFTSGRHSIPKMFETRQTMTSLNALNKSALNGSENIYWISFQSVLDSLK